MLSIILRQRGRIVLFPSVTFPLTEFMFHPLGACGCRRTEVAVHDRQRCGTGGVVIYAVAHAFLFSLLLSVLLMVYLAFIYLVYPESFLQSRYPPSRG